MSSKVAATSLNDADRELRGSMGMPSTWACSTRSSAVGVVVHLVDEGRPAVLEGQLGADLVEDVDPRGQAGLDGVLAQDAEGEGVQGADGGDVGVGQGRLAPAPDLGGRVLLEGLLEGLPDPVTQLGARRRR